MTFSPVPTVATGDLWTAANHNTYLKDNMAALNQMASNPAMVKITEQVLAGSAAEVLFTSIPSTYRNLKLSILARLDTANAYADVYLQLNGDTGANYDSHTLKVDAGVSESYNLGVTNFPVGYFNGSLVSAGKAGVSDLFLLGYSQTSFYKSIRVLNHYHSNLSTPYPFSREIFGFWMSTAAIGQIRVFPLGCNFVAGSIFTLYGIS